MTTSEWGEKGLRNLKKQKKKRTVDPIIDPLVYPVDLRAQRRGIEIELGLIVQDERVELRVEHADDLR